MTGRFQGELTGEGDGRRRSQIASRGLRTDVMPGPAWQCSVGHAGLGEVRVYPRRRGLPFAPGRLWVSMQCRPIIRTWERDCVTGLWGPIRAVAPDSLLAFASSGKGRGRHSQTSGARGGARWRLALALRCLLGTTLRRASAIGLAQGSSSPKLSPWQRGASSVLIGTERCPGGSSELGEWPRRPAH